MKILADNGLSELFAEPDETRLCTGFAFTEGPVWVADDDCLLFSDIPGNRIHRWRPGTDTAEIYREPSGNSNGLTLDLQGNLLACEHSGRRVSRAPYEGAVETVVDFHEGLRLNNPNDLVVHSSGAIYFTNPWLGDTLQARMGDPSASKEIDFQGVYRVGLEGDVACVARGFVFPNGLAFSPDESILYINDSRTGKIHRFDVQADGSLQEGELLVDMTGADGIGVPDGMKVDEAGRIWSTGIGGVWVLEPGGTLCGIFELDDEHAANLNWGGPGFASLFLTAQTSVYRVETTVRGIAPGSRSRYRHRSRRIGAVL